MFVSTPFNLSTIFFFCGGFILMNLKMNRQNKTRKAKEVWGSTTLAQTSVGNYKCCACHKVINTVQQQYQLWLYLAKPVPVTRVETISLTLHRMCYICHASIEWQTQAVECACSLLLGSHDIKLTNSSPSAPVHFFDREKRWRSRKVKEALWTQNAESTLNRDKGWDIDPMRLSLLWLVTTEEIIG